MKKYWISILSSCFISFFSIQAQIQNAQGPYLFPIRPGQQNFLSGSMAELRATHFHAGIDIKVGGITGWPIYAAADGFVSRIKVSTVGYGNALYLQHPDGTTTVYAHLLKYEDQLQKYIRQHQYKNESFEIELMPKRDEITFKRGDVIGIAGNTGSSMGPHLHFEIRDANQHVMDPLKFGFAEVKDNLAPVVPAIALKTLDIDARINGTFGTFIFKPQLINGEYIIKEPVHIQGKVGVAVYSYDRMNGVPNRNGVPSAELLLDDQVLFSQNITSLSFGEMRNIHVHVDFPLLLATGHRYNKLYVDHGNSLSFLKDQPGSGYFHIQDQNNHRLEIRLTDTYNNTRKVKLNISGKATHGGIQKMIGNLRKEQMNISGNVLEIERQQGSDTTNLSVYTNRLTYELSPAFFHQDKPYYLWDLRTGLPDSLKIGGEKMIPGFLTTVFPNTELKYYHQAFDIHFYKTTVFDTLHLRFKKEKDITLKKEEFQFLNTTTPLRNNATIHLKPEFEYEERKTHVYTVYENGKLGGFVGGSWKGRTISFNTRDLGSFTLATDTVPPSVTILKANSLELKVRIDDTMSGIKDYRAEVNGKWVLMNYDYKQKLLWSEKMDENIPFSGELTILVRDRANNITTIKSKI